MAVKSAHIPVSVTGTDTTDAPPDTEYLREADAERFGVKLAGDRERGRKAYDAARAYLIFRAFVRESGFPGHEGTIAYALLGKKAVEKARETGRALAEI